MAPSLKFPFGPITRNLRLGQPSTGVSPYSSPHSTAELIVFPHVKFKADTKTLQKGKARRAPLPDAPVYRSLRFTPSKKGSAVGQQLAAK
jgi:hypothetical protein